jgi:hypothetical protein
MHAQFMKAASCMDGITIGAPTEFANARSGVVRIGQTVRRPAHRNTPTVQSLLKHLEEKGFDEAPRALGIDKEGREMVSYINGTAGHYPLRPYVLSESTLIQVALLLRRYHDASASFSPPATSGWGCPVAGRREVFCHGDAGPYNIIFRNGKPVALIDFERATPGPRIWDIGFAVYRFAPLCDLPEAGLTPGFLRRIALRIRAFLTAYGVAESNGLFDWIQLRLKTEIDLFECAKADDLTGRQVKIDAGHLDLYKRDLRQIEEVSGHLRALM